jgi:hypothetical protein
MQEFFFKMFGVLGLLGSMSGVAYAQIEDGQWKLFFEEKGPMIVGLAMLAIILVIVKEIGYFLKLAKAGGTITAIIVSILFGHELAAYPLSLTDITQWETAFISRLVIVVIAVVIVLSYVLPFLLSYIIPPKPYQWGDPRFPRITIHRDVYLGHKRMVDYIPKKRK